ncbi:hypothetical protein ASE12_02060 [Aeromicrobium sp. Root236]|uniref:TerB family tellurite resistance protein n=1 Tax=Aeromicrobium sp. Root236 TaxID=1736498 RepID=UPI00070197F4|nr:TerB family tellurite resistance protein [Aeromicrobium sp. Root236]KRC63654.1 hypothetical protein ASE12_02060 [Aeromicrobium sp. Root236]
MTTVLLIWGFKVLYKSLSSGVFYCPHDGGDREYTLKQGRKWFTFFFIPLIPLKVLGEFVECNTCKSGYDPKVLSQPTAAGMADKLANAVRAAAVAIINADGQVSEQEKNVALEIMAKYSDTPYAAQHLDADLQQLTAADLDGALADVADMLSEQGKESLLDACVAIAAADGAINDGELALIERAGRGLGMTPAHLRGTIDQARETYSA